MAPEVIKELRGIGKSLKKLSLQIEEHGYDQNLAYVVSEEGERILDLLGGYQSEEGAYNEPS